LLVAIFSEVKLINTTTFTTNQFALFTSLTFEQPGWYLNFSAWFMKNKREIM
jgi:hypothetical protein